MTKVEQIRNQILSEADQLRAERERRIRRHEILQVAGQLACGAIASNAKLGIDSREELIEIIVETAALIVDEVDRVTR